MNHQEVKREKHNQEKRKMSLAALMGSSTESREGQGSTGQTNGRTEPRTVSSSRCQCPDDFIGAKRSLKKTRMTMMAKKLFEKKVTFKIFFEFFRDFFKIYFLFIFQIVIFNDRLKI